MGILNIIKGVGALKHLGQVIPVIKAVSSAWDDIQAVYDGAKEKWDSDRDGNPDLTPTEVLDLIREIIVVILKHSQKG